MRPFLIALLALGCAGGTPPKRVLSTYLEAEQTGRYAEAHELLTSSDQAARSLELYAHDHLQAGPVWLEVAQTTRFRLGKAETRDDVLFVQVEAEYFDLRAVAEGIPGIPTDVLQTSPDPVARMRQHVRTSLASQSFPTVKEGLTYALREEDEGWRVWVGFDRLDAGVKAASHAQATAAAGDVDATRAAWEAVLALPEDPQGAVASLKEQARAALEALPLLGEGP